MTPIITWHGHDLPLCPPDQQPWPALALTDICRTLAHLPRFNAAQRCVVEPKDRARADATSTPWSVAQHLLLCGLLAVEHVGKDRATSSRPEIHADAITLDIAPPRWPVKAEGSDSTQPNPATQAQQPEPTT